MTKICIVDMHEECDYESTVKLVMTIPEAHWIDATEEEIKVYQRYCNILNRKRGCRYYVIQAFGLEDLDQFTLDKARKEVEADEKKKAEAKAKRDAAAQRKKLNKELKDKEFKKELLVDMEAQNPGVRVAIEHLDNDIAHIKSQINAL